jgi:excisionase family DNA binding protein
MTLKEAALYCGVNYDTFHTWLRKGVLPHVEVGPSATLRVRRGDVQRLVREVPTPA